jgi:hypothetical protein
MANKRQYRRFIRRCETEFSAGEQTFRGIASDFSVSGMFIRTQNPLPPDAVLDIKVLLPDGSTSQLSGLVRRAARSAIGRYLGLTGGKVQKSGMGVELTEKDANYLDFLRSFLAEDELADDAEVKAAVESLREQEEETKEESPEEPPSERPNTKMSEMLIHLIATQQALINLLDRQGVINKRDIAEEMKKLRKK